MKTESPVEQPPLLASKSSHRLSTIDVYDEHDLQVLFKVKEGRRDDCEGGSHKPGRGGRGRPPAADDHTSLHPDADSSMELTVFMPNVGQ